MTRTNAFTDFLRVHDALRGADLTHDQKKAAIEIAFAEYANCAQPAPLLAIVTDIVERLWRNDAKAESAPQAKAAAPAGAPKGPVAPRAGRGRN